MLCVFCLSGNYVLNYLATRPKLATFVTQALIQLYARITKLGWFDCQKDEYVFRNVITDVTRFLQVGCLLLLLLLHPKDNLCNAQNLEHCLEMNEKSCVVSLTLETCLGIHCHC